MLDIPHLRSETPGCAHRIHLNNAGAALIPQPVADAVQQYLQTELLHGGYEAVLENAGVLNGFYEGAARLLHTHSRNIAFTGSATDSYSKSLSSIPFEAGDVLLTTDDDYVSNQIAFIFLQKRFKIKVLRAAKLPEGGVDVHSVDELMRRHRPKLVAVTHVPTNSGLVQDVEAVGRLCRAQEVWYLVDACQSAGQLPLDVEKIGCDFLSATLRKWLRGPRGTGLLYASDRALAAGLEPIFPDMTGGNWVTDAHYNLRSDARRFEYWEKPYALMAGSATALEYALNLGLENIEQRVTELSNFARQRLAEVPNVRVLDRGARRCGIVTFHLAGVSPEVLKKSMDAAGINTGIGQAENALIDFREKGVAWAMRVSPHYYNTVEEIDLMVEVVGSLAVRQFDS